MYYSFLRPCILEPTRIVANKRPILIDNIFINTIDKKIDSGNIIDKVSDRMPDFVLVKDIIEIKKYQRIKIRDMKNFNRKKYLRKLEEINTMLLLQYKNVNEMFETFQNQFLSITDNNASIIILSRKKSILRQKPWLTKGILESIRIKKQLYKKYIKKKDTFWFERYKYYRNKVNMLISKSKRNYLRKFFQEVENNLKKTWTKINGILNEKCNDKNNIFLSENGQVWQRTNLITIL